MLGSLWAEFKSFAFKGNMIDLAVAVVIGAAFSGVINSLVKDVIMPTVSYAVTAVSETTHAAQNLATTASQSVGLTKPADTQPATTQSATEPAAADVAVPATQPVAAMAGPTTSPAGPIVVYVTAPTPPAAKDEKPPEKAVDFTWKLGRVDIGSFIGSLVNFVIIAFAVFIMIVKLLGSAMKRVAGGTPKADEPTTKECPECLSVIPIKAKRCAHCTAVLPPAN